MPWRLVMAVVAVVAVVRAVTSAAAYTKFHGRPKPSYNGLTPYTKHFLPGGRTDSNCDHAVNPGDTSWVAYWIAHPTPPAEYITPCPDSPAYTGLSGTNPTPRERADVNGDGATNPGDQAFIAHYYGHLRDKLTQPFNEYSHWNTPLSLDATFTTIDFWDDNAGYPGGTRYDLDYFFVASETDPLFDCPSGSSGCTPTPGAAGTIYSPGDVSTNRCTGGTPQPYNQVRMHFPATVVIPDVPSSGSPQFNSSVAVLQPDGETLVELNVACHVAGSLSLYGNQTGRPNYSDPSGCPTPTLTPTRTPTPTGTLTPTSTFTATPTGSPTPYCHREFAGEVQSIYGLDYRSTGSEAGGGGHAGSGLSAIGGSVRLGELVGTATITHALKVNIACADYCKKAIRTNTPEPTPVDGDGWRWPAVRADCCTTYGGTIDGLQMGSLVALECSPDPNDSHCTLTADNITSPTGRLPPGCPSSAGLSTNLAKRLFHAFRDWGAYVADNSDLPTLDVEAGVPEEVLADSEAIDMWAEHGDTGNTHAYYCDWWRIWANVKLVASNNSTHVGGSAAESGTSAAELRFHFGIKRPPPIGN